MPVVSPSRYSASSGALSGSYRSSLVTASLERPYYRTSPTYVASSLRADYRARYSDADGKRERKSSLVERVEYGRLADADARSERSESRSRDVSTTRSESGRAAGGERGERGDRSKRGALGMSTAELYSKYSPANYVPLTQRLQQARAQGDMARSKSTSADIGRPPAPDARLRRARNSAAAIAERPEGRRLKEGSPTGAARRDSNGNEVPSVAEIRKRFDRKMAVTRLPANDAVERYLSRLKEGEGRRAPSPRDERPVPVHLPRVHDQPSAAPAAPDPIGKILERSTVIQVENGDSEHSEHAERRRPVRNGLDAPAARDARDAREARAARHTSDFASYIQMSQPGPRAPPDLEYADAERDDGPAAGFENKTFEHENYLKRRGERAEGAERAEREDAPGSMETSTESTISEPAGDSSPEAPPRRPLDASDYDDIRAELAGGKSAGAAAAGAGAGSVLRRSSERADSGERADRPSSQTSGLNGLRNIGNTCFMNSVVQCLSNTRPLLEYLVADGHAREINTTLSCMKGALIKAFASVIKELWRSGEKDSVVNTTSLKSQVQRFAPRFMGFSQQDAQEFLRYLLEGLHEDVNRVTVKPKPILTEIDDNLSDSAKAAEAWSRYLRMEESRVGDIFVGQLKSTLRCTHCRHDSVTFDPFWDLSLPIPSRTGNLKLQQCLQHFVREEELDGDEKPTCSKCGVRRKCLKWFTVQKFPNVLVLHLKRFSPTERFRGKLSVPVEFPLNGLDMAPFAASPAAPPATYNLYAVSNHSGTTYSGHYTAYCKHPYTGDWHEYNDSRVTPINPRDVVSPEAYVLFYELATRT